MLRESLDAYRRVVARVKGAAWDAPRAPGKWTPRQILVHVAQWEMILGVRLRLGLYVPGYRVEPTDQDLLMSEAAAVRPEVAAAAFDAVRTMHVALAGSLTSADRARTFTHVERGTIDVESILVTMAGHGVHHLRQLESIAR